LSRGESLEELEDESLDDELEEDDDDEEEEEDRRRFSLFFSSSICLASSRCNSSRFLSKEI
jgi:hypothetical protein